VDGTSLIHDLGGRKKMIIMKGMLEGNQSIFQIREVPVREGCLGKSERGFRSEGGRIST